MSLFPAQLNLESLKKAGVGNLCETLGLTFTEVGPDFLKAELTVDDRHLRPGNIMNGGVSLALIETVASVAARCTILGEPKNSLGIQVNANHLQVANPGDRLVAVARPIHVGRTTQVWEVNIENQKGKLVSTGRITMLVVSNYSR